MAIQFVTSNQVFEVNGEFFAYPDQPNGITKAIPCKSEVMGFYWMTPKVQGNRVIGYSIQNSNSNIKPTPDSFKILRVKDAIDANIEYGMAVVDGDGITTNSFIDKCNGCCGDTPVMATVTIPAPILQLPPQTVSDDGTERTWIFPFPVNPNGLLYAIPYPWFNGAAPTPAYAPSGITTPAQFVTWADTNWGEYGEWSSSGNIVTLVNADTDDIILALAGMEISLTPAIFCFDVSTMSPPAAVNSINFGGTGNPKFTFPPFMLTGSNQQTLINSIKKFVTDGTFTISTGKLQVATTQGLPRLYNGATLVLASTAGAC